MSAARAPRPLATLGPGDRAGRFRVGRLVHEGGMARLYSVAGGRSRSVLLKVPKLGPGHPLSSLVAFENEINILRRLHGPHVPRLLAHSAPGEPPYLAMEYIEGCVLADAARRAPIGIDEACDLGVRLCRAVQALHHQNVIHLDLNPSNVRNRANGEMVLIDYGMAHHANLPDLHDPAFGEAEGTAAGIAPEQLQHVRSDSRSDIYAIGVILYQLVTGRYPYGRPTLFSLKQRLVQPPSPPRCHNPAIPAWLQEIILRCLELHPEQRYSTTKRVAQLLAHPETVHVGARGRLVRTAGVVPRLLWWWRSLFRVFNEEAPVRPYDRLARSPHVLVALDLAHCSDALREALRRAVRRLAESEPHSYFTCLSVIPRRELAGRSGTRAAAPDLSTQAGMRHWAQPLRLESPRLVFQVLPGDPARTIVEYVRVHQVDQVILGARGSSALRRHLGSVSAVVAAQAPCTVVVVRTRHDRATGKRQSRAPTGQRA